MPSTSIDTVGAAELAELLQFLTDWLASHADHLCASLASRFLGSRGYAIKQLCIDLCRFTFLLGGNDGEAPLPSRRASVVRKRAGLPPRLRV
jgi:hypothetical protein